MLVDESGYFLSSNPRENESNKEKIIVSNQGRRANSPFYQIMHTWILLDQRKKSSVMIVTDQRANDLDFTSFNGLLINLPSYHLPCSRLNFHLEVGFGPGLFLAIQFLYASWKDIGSKTYRRGTWYKWSGHGTCLKGMLPLSALLPEGRTLSLGREFGWLWLLKD